MHIDSLRPIDATCGLPRRWIVCDWGALRSLGKVVRLPGDACFVVSDFTFLEASDGAAQRGHTIDKLQSLLSIPDFLARVLVGHHWQTLALEEHRTKTPSAVHDTIDHDATVQIRGGPPPGPRWADRLLHARKSDGYLDYEAAKSEFVACGNAFASAPENRGSAVLQQLRRDASSLRTFIRRPAIVTDFLYASRLNPSWRSRKWRYNLEVFPDRFAVGRWARLLAYYGIRRLMAPEERGDRFSNNFEDATYAFLASYTGFLASKDIGLRRCVGDLFPNVSLVDLDAATP